MPELSKALAVISIALLLQINVASAEQPTGRLPGVFPGSGGFPEPPRFGDLPPAYPEWPERPVFNEIIPPPPGGPYMSSAMTDITVFPEDTGGLRHEIREQMAPSPFFTADMPWPDTPEHDRPQPWLPDGGEYNYVPDDIVRQLESSTGGQRPLYPAYQPYPRYPPPMPMRRPYYGY